jgi:hypothetical protein
VGENDRPSAVFYAQVDDIEGKLNQAVKLGGSIVVPVTEVPGMVTFAQFADPEGNVIGLVKGPETPPPQPQAKRRTTTRKAAPKKAARKRAVSKAKTKAKPKAKPKAKRSARRRK